MNAIDTQEEKIKKVRARKVLDVLKKILMYTGITIGALVALVVIYKVLEFLLMAAILFIAWIGVPRRWR